MLRFARMAELSSKTQQGIQTAGRQLRSDVEMPITQRCGEAERRQRVSDIVLRIAKGSLTVFPRFTPVDAR